jgi:glycosyltransferase involved in cell wall biosynthesis
VQRSTQIITVSEYVKSALVQQFSVSSAKIAVTYESAELPVPVSTTDSRMFLSDHGIGPRYFFYVGNAHPHKNLDFLLQVFATFRSSHPDTQLVLAGAENYFWKRLMTESSQLLDGVLYLGKVSDVQLATLYSHALGYVFPSLSEGFGLPLLEAMSYGCPVISSSATSLPEIGGAAALYFDPTDPHSLCDHMERIYRSDGLREQLAAKGFERISHFSWKKMTEQTVALYR